MRKCMLALCAATAVGVASAKDLYTSEEHSTTPFQFCFWSMLQVPSPSSACPATTRPG